MKLSYNWLKELVPELVATPTEIATLLTNHSFETEVVGKIEIDEHVIVAKIVAINPHPNADRLQLVTVASGSEEIQVVCGARNIAVGDIVPFSPPQTRLLDSEGNIFTLSATTIRGVESPGMLNSPRELGLGDLHSGIYILPGDTPIGSSLRQHIPVDTILEADVTPNRAHDCLSHVGIAREIAALENLTMAEPPCTGLPIETLSDWKLVIDDATNTPRYLGILLENVQVAASPLWLQARLWAVGARPINNLVDITNYVLFEVGNPSHLFDVAKLPGKTIGVRYALSQEQLTTLDGRSRLLSSEKNIIITSNNIPVALAGVMGGQGSEVGAGTKDTFLEVANFQPYAIQESASSAKVRTESSLRFSKGIAPSIAEVAAKRLLQLITDLAGGKTVGLIQHYPKTTKRQSIFFQPQRVEKYAGYTISEEQTYQALERLRYVVRKDNDKTWVITPPPERLDIAGEHDLIEEVIRFIGLDAIPDTSPTIGKKYKVPPKVQVREYIRDHLVAAGLTEVYNRPFEQLRFAKLLKFPTETAVAISNPVAPEQSFLRISLVPLLCENLVTNKGLVRRKRLTLSRNIFEVNTVWHAGRDGRVPGVREEEHVAAVIVDRLSASTIVEDILKSLGVNSAPNGELWHSGTIERSALTAMKLPVGIQYFVINLDTLVPLLPEDFAYLPQVPAMNAQYKAINKFPTTYRDLSVIVGTDIAIDQVEEIIHRVGGELVVEVDLFDEYQPAESEKRGLAFHITYQAPDRTLTSDEVHILQNKIVATLQEEIAASERV